MIIVGTQNLRAFCWSALVLVTACGGDLPHDHGVLWECRGHADRDHQAIATFPTETNIRKCANADVPVKDVRDACYDNCVDEFCEYGVKTKFPFIIFCLGPLDLGVTCWVEDPEIIGVPCDDSAARISATASGPARDEIAATATAHLDVDGHTGATTASGAFRYTIAECDGDPCELHIPYFEFTAKSFSVAGKSITNVSVRNGSAIYGRRFASGAFEIPPGALAVSVVFNVDGSSASTTLTNEAPVTGMINPDTDQFSISGTFSKGKVTVDLTMTGSHTNRAPNAVALPTGTVECNSPSGADVTLDGRGTTDPDNNIRDYFWVVNDTPIAGSGALVPATLPFGDNTVDLEVLDTRLSIDTAESTVSVVDTTSPVLVATATPSCLVPTSHKYVRFDLGTDIQVSAADACDASPSVRITSVTSNEPDSSPGDGNTTNDVIFGSDGFCIRAERSDGGDRVYTVVLEAVDASGNVSTQQVQIIVPHDRRTSCPRLPSDRFISDREAATQCVFQP